MKKTLSLAQQVFSLFKSVPPPPPLDDDSAPQGNKGVTIRFSPSVYHSLKHHAETTGCSIQDIVSMTMTSVMMTTDAPAKQESQLLIDRFRYLFAANDLNSNEIPDFLRIPGITRSVTNDDKALLDVLDKETRELVAKIFQINSDWLAGKDSPLVRAPQNSYWYKSVNSVVWKLVMATSKNVKAKVNFVINDAQTGDEVSLEQRFRNAEKRDDGDNRLEVGIFISYNHSHNGYQFKTHEILGYERWNYSKCRTCLRAIYEFCQSTSIKTQGLTLQSEAFRALFNGSIYAGEVLSERLAEVIDLESHFYPIDSISTKKRSSILNDENSELGIRHMDLYKKVVLEPYAIKNMNALERHDIEDVF